jgi:hypothetical protein
LKHISKHLSHQIFYGWQAFKRRDYISQMLDNGEAIQETKCVTGTTERDRVNVLDVMEELFHDEKAKRCR